MSTGCEFYADALVELAAGSLEEARVERVEAHLATCESCRRSLEVIRAVRRAPAPVPEALEARLQGAVRGVAVARPARAPGAGSGIRPSWESPWRGWRPWALPAAAAAALALWIGAGTWLGVDSPAPGGDPEVAVEYEPYGAWPGSNGEVAGELVLSELSVEELEALLEEMQS